MINTTWNHCLTVFQVILGVVYFSSGLSKLVPGFPNIIGPVWLIEELSKYDLGLFGYFIGIMQTAIGGLLLISRFRLIAGLMLLPIHMCTLIIPISCGWQGTPYINAIFLCMLLAILFEGRKKLYSLIGTQPIMFSLTPNKVYIATFIAIWCFAVFLKIGF